MSSRRIMRFESVEAVRESASLFTAASHENPPAYSEASSAFSEAHSTTAFSPICCAYDVAVEDNLRRHQSFDFIVQDLSAYRCLAQESRRLLFLYWVAYCSRSVPSASEAGLIPCPLSGCHQAFYSHGELVDHVGKCSRLAQGKYYCPYHRNEEHFAEPTTIEIAAVNSNTSRKHFLKGAINALRRGSRSFRNAMHPLKHTAQRQVSVPVQPHAEKEISYCREMPKLTARANIHEMDVPESTLVVARTHATYTPELPGVCPTFEMEAGLSGPAELDSPSCPSMEWSSTITSTGESVASPISPISPIDGRLMRSFEDTSSPVSPTDTINSFPDFGSPAQPIKPQDSTIYQKGPTSSYQVYELWATPVSPIFREITAFMLPNSNEHIYAPKHEIAAVRDRVGQRMLEYNNVVESSGFVGARDRFGVEEHTDTPPNNKQKFYSRAPGFDDVTTTSTDALEQNRRLKEAVIDELLPVLGLENFRAMVLDVEKKLDFLRVVHPKELRVMLLHNANRFAKSPEDLKTFANLVDYLCEVAEFALLTETPVGEDYDLHKIGSFQDNRSGTELHDYSYTDQQQQVHSASPSSSYSPFNTSGAAGLSELPGAMVSPRIFRENEVLSQSRNYSTPQAYPSPQTYDPHTSPTSILNTPELDDNLDNNFMDNHTSAPSLPEHPEALAADPALSTFPPGKGSVTCKVCFKVLTGKLDWLPSNLQRHMREKHTPSGGKRFQCSQCPKDFSRKSNLQVHLNTVHKGTSGR